MFKLGLTGSIGMGKSTTARIFKDLGCGVWDADQAVHRIYDVNGPAVLPIGQLWPHAIENTAVSRVALKKIIMSDSGALKVLEGIVHPLVRADREAFVNAASEDVIVFDIPLLFEANSQHEFDAVACVLVPEEEQTRRVLARGTMSREQLDLIRTKQLPHDEKAARSDYVIVTDTPENARRQVVAILEDISAERQHA